MLSFFNRAMADEVPQEPIGGFREGAREFITLLGGAMHARPLQAQHACRSPPMIWKYGAHRSIYGG
jgi:hypothetical protein